MGSTLKGNFTSTSRRKQLDDAKRQEIYAETQRITQQYLPFIYLVAPLSLAVVRDRLQNVKFSALGSQMGTLWNKYELKVTEKS